MEQFSVQADELIRAIKKLPLEEQRKIAEEVLRQAEEQAQIEKRQAILALAGSWNHFPEENTDDLPDDMKRDRQEMFNRKVDQESASAEKKPKYNALQQLLLNGPVMTDEQYQAFLDSRNHFDNSGQADWSDDHLPNSLLSPEDEKNVRRIWKSPGGC